MANELLIKINADAKNAKKAFDDIKDQTEDLEEVLKSVALVSAAAFAAFTAEVFFSVKAFEEAQQASVQLTNALQNQGIYTDDLKKSYEDFADVVQAKTGIDNDAIIKAQAIAQTFLGQTAITQELTTSIADLSAFMGGDLNGAAEKIARTIGTSTNAFARQGLVISETATEAERMAKVLEFVRSKAGGLAEEFNKADGYSQALSTAFGNLQEKIGSKFAPAVAAARLELIGFLDAIRKSEFLTTFAVSVIAAGVAVSGITALAAVAVPAFTALSAAATTAGLSLTFAFAGIPLIIAGLVGGITFLALNWDKALSSMVAAVRGAVVFISEAFSGLAKVIAGVLTFDPKQVDAGVKQLVESLKTAKEEAFKTYDEVYQVQAADTIKQEADKAAAAARTTAKEREHQANLRGIQAAELELIKLQNENASAALIALKIKEIETLKALDQDKSAAELELLRARRDAILALEDQQNQEDVERATEFDQILADTKSELKAKGIEVDAQLSQQRLAEIRATAKVEEDIDRQVQEDIIKRRIEARNQELLDRKKYGTAVATINKALNSDEVKGASQAASELVQLQQSKNSTLKAIGKAAAVAQITVDTARSAMNIFQGFTAAVPPPFGIALGIAGAAAAVAFGAEKVGNVTAAADGGLIEGGVNGKDSVPALLMPGELVVPRRNFNDVVGALSGNKTEGNGEMVSILERIENKLSTPQTTIINGDVTSDDTYVDSLVRKISDAIEFRNAQIYGVTG